jgi:pimeloyl-ACP methyl ester carboxylesterase
MTMALHVEDSGSGTPVVLLHSSGLSGRQWRRLVPGLVSRGFRNIVPDLTGHGASEAWPEPRPFSFTTDVDALVALLDAHGPAHVVGHSYGAFVGLIAALAAPRSIRSMVLFEPVAFGTLDPAADADASAGLARVAVRWGPSDREREQWLQTFVDYWGGEGAWSALREEARAEFRRVGWVVSEGVRTLMEDRTPATAYRAIQFPVRVLTGEGSPIAARRVAQRLGESIPSAEVITIPGAGHMAPLTHADLVNGKIVEALAARPAGDDKR